MESRAREVMRECAKASAEERVTFGEVVKALMDVGCERYVVDLVRAETTFYLPNGESERVSSHAAGRAAAIVFSAAGVEAAVRSVQGGEIQYRAFCERVMEAGCVGYIASMAGRRVVYFGRTGECHVEYFPDPR